MKKLLTLIFLLAPLMVFTQKEFAVFHTNESIKIDGKLENIWFKADSTSNFVQLEPFIGDPSSRRTVVRAIQTEKSLFFSFVCYIDDPSEIVSKIQQRDGLEPSDDLAILILDTYHDKRTAVVFGINPTGTLKDL